MALIPLWLFVEWGIYWKSYPGFIWNLTLLVPPFCQWNWSTCVTFHLKKVRNASRRAWLRQGKDSFQGSLSRSWVNSFYLCFWFCSFLLRMQKTLESKSLLLKTLILITDKTSSSSQSSNYVHKFQHNACLVLLNRTMRLWKNENIDFLWQRQGGLSFGFL